MPLSDDQNQRVSFPFRLRLRCAELILGGAWLGAWINSRAMSVGAVTVAASHGVNPSARERQMWINERFASVYSTFSFKSFSFLCGITLLCDSADSAGRRHSVL